MDAGRNSQDEQLRRDTALLLAFALSSCRAAATATTTETAAFTPAPTGLQLLSCVYLHFAADFAAHLRCLDYVRFQESEVTTPLRSRAFLPIH